MTKVFKDCNDKPAPTAADGMTRGQQLQMCTGPAFMTLSDECYACTASVPLKTNQPKSLEEISAKCKCPADQVCKATSTADPKKEDNTAQSASTRPHPAAAELFFSAIALSAAMHG